MKTIALIAAATLASVVAAKPVPWTKVSPRSQMAAAIAANSELVSRSITSDASEFSSHTYDYVIVGAGTAGLAVAARLSESGKYTVGVLEAGGTGYNVSIIDTPGDFGADVHTQYDWNYTTVARGDVPSTAWPRGKVLGGSSALNFLVWDRPSSYELDAWEELGNPGWNWTTLYRTMKKSEHFHTPSQQNCDLLGIQPDASDYGNNGPVQVAYPNYITPQVQRWVGALSELGIPKNDHPLAGENIGVSQQPSDINPTNYTRSYSAPSYLFPNAARENLNVLTNAHVTKIHFDTEYEKLHAQGVSFVSNGKTYSVKAAKEVILSSGTVNTPQLLELSGIGNKQLLSKLGIKTLYNNPNVGENMQDHTYSATVYALQPGTITLDLLKNDPAFAQEQAALYAANQSSILSEAVPSISYISLAGVVGNETAEAMIANVTEYVAASTAPYKAGLEKQLEYLTKRSETVGQMELVGIDGYFASTGTPQPNTTYFTILCANQHLFSRGDIHIQSSDPNTYPLIHSNYFSVPFDVEISTAGTNYSRKVGFSKTYSDIVVDEYWPGAQVNQQNYTIKTSVTEYHPIGTASMLPRDKGGVVDPSLRVYGTKNLRVVDASIMPLHIAAHIQATMYGVAEYASEIILSQA